VGCGGEHEVAALEDGTEVLRGAEFGGRSELESPAPEQLAPLPEIVVEGFAQRGTEVGVCQVGVEEPDDQAAMTLVPAFLPVMEGGPGTDEEAAQFDDVRLLPFQGVTQLVGAPETAIGRAPGDYRTGDADRGGTVLADLLVLVSRNQQEVLMVGFLEQVFPFRIDVSADSAARGRVGEGEVTVAHGRGEGGRFRREGELRRRVTRWRALRRRQPYPPKSRRGCASSRGLARGRTP